MGTVKLSGIEYAAKFSFRTYMLYEEITDGKSVQDIKGIKDMIKLFYCSLKAYNDSFNYSFEQFVDLIEEEPSVFNDLTSLFTTSLGEVKKKDKPITNSMHIPFKRLYAIVVVKCKVNPEYFLDSMTNYELNALLEYANELNKEEWERLRMQCFYSVIPHTTDRKLTPEKVMPFYWDNINKKAGTKINIDNDKNRIDELLKKTE